MTRWFTIILCVLTYPALAAGTKAPPRKAPAATKRSVPRTQAARRAAPKAAAKAHTPLYELDSPAYQLPPKGTALRRLLKSQVLRVCVRTDVPPFGYFAQTGLVGFDIDLSKALATQLSIFFKKNLTLSWVTIPAKARTSSLQQDRCDFVAAAFSRTAARAKKIGFTRAYLRTDKVILGSANITRAKPIIGLLKGTTNSAKGFKGVPRFFTSYKEMIYAMEAGEIDYIVTDRPIAQHLKRSVTRPFLVVKSLPGAEYYAIGVRKGRPHLLRALNAALSQLARSGQLAYLQRQWL